MVRFLQVNNNLSYSELFIRKYGSDNTTSLKCWENTHTHTHKCQARMLHAAKMYFKKENKVKTFSDQREREGKSSGGGDR